MRQLQHVVVSCDSLVRIPVPVPGVVDEEELPEVDHLLERVHPRRDGHQVVEELGGGRKILEHELLVAERVENVLRGEQPALPIVDLDNL